MIERGTSYDDPSGHRLAEAAHDAGAVEPVERVGTVDVQLEIVVRGSLEHGEALASAAALELMTRSDVVSAVYTVTEREPAE